MKLDTHSPIPSGRERQAVVACIQDTEPRWCCQSDEASVDDASVWMFSVNPELFNAGSEIFDRFLVS